MSRVLGAQIGLTLTLRVNAHPRQGLRALK